MATSGASERPEHLRGWLDWHEAFLDRLDDRAFLMDLGPTLELLRRPGPAAEVLDELLTEVDARVAQNLTAQDAARALAESWAETWEMQSKAARAAAEVLRGEVQHLKTVRPSLRPSGTTQASPVRDVLNKLDAVAMSAVDSDPS